MLTYPYWKIAGLLAWGVVVVGLIGIIRLFTGNMDDSVEIIYVLLSPISGALIGGFLGKSLISKFRKR